MPIHPSLECLQWWRYWNFLRQSIPRSGLRSGRCGQQPREPHTHMHMEKCEKPACTAVLFPALSCLSWSLPQAALYHPASYLQPVLRRSRLGSVSGSSSACLPTCLIHHATLPPCWTVPHAIACLFLPAAMPLACGNGEGVGRKGFERACRGGHQNTSSPRLTFSLSLVLSLPLPHYSNSQGVFFFPPAIQSKSTLMQL